MTQATYKLNLSLDLTLEQIQEIVLNLPNSEQNKILEVIIKNRQELLNNKSTTKLDLSDSFNREISKTIKENTVDLITVFERISNNARSRGLTEEILEELLSDES
jgi:hypothetical protein